MARSGRLPEIVPEICGRIGTARRAPARLAQNERAVDFESTRKVLSNATRAFGSGWHLSLARRLTIPYHGPLGFAVVTAPNVREAVSVLLRFVGTRSPFVWLAGFQEDDEFVVRLHEPVHLGDARELLIEIVWLSFQGRPYWAGVPEAGLRGSARLVFSR